MVNTVTTQQEHPGFSLVSTSSIICMWDELETVNCPVFCVQIVAWHSSLYLFYETEWLYISTHTHLINFSLLVAARSIHSRGGSENFGITLYLWEIATLHSHCIEFNCRKTILWFEVDFFFLFKCWLKKQKRKSKNNFNDTSVLDMNKKRSLICKYIGNKHEHYPSHFTNLDGPAPACSLTSSLHPLRQVKRFSCLTACSTAATASDLLPYESSAPWSDTAPSLGGSNTSVCCDSSAATCGGIQPTCAPSTSKRRQLGRHEPEEIRN